MFSIGFMSLLHIAIDQMVEFPSWENALISAPGIKHLCEPGKYHSNFTTSAYCQDSYGNTQKSSQCLQCPENMYTDTPNQDQCKPCSEGYYAPSGSSMCISCYQNTGVSNRTQNNCAVFIQSKTEERRKLYMEIFIPIGIVLFLISVYLIYRNLRHRFIKQRALGNDENWLLSFDELVKPPINRLESHHNFQMCSKQTGRQRNSNNDKSSTPPDTGIVDDWQSVEGDRDHIVSQGIGPSTINPPESLPAETSGESLGVSKPSIEDRMLSSRMQSDSSSKPPFLRVVGYQ